MRVRWGDEEGHVHAIDLDENEIQVAWDDPNIALSEVAADEPDLELVAPSFNLEA